MSDVRDVIWLVADLECRATLTGFLDRKDFHTSLRCKPFLWNPDIDLIREEKGKDAGVWKNSHLLLRAKRISHRHAVVLLDNAFDVAGAERSQRSTVACAVKIRVETVFQTRAFDDHESAGTRCGQFRRVGKARGLFEVEDRVVVFLARLGPQLRRFFDQSVDALFQGLPQTWHGQVGDVMGFQMLNDRAVRARGHQRNAELAAQESVEVAGRNFVFVGNHPK